MAKSTPKRGAGGRFVKKANAFFRHVHHPGTKAQPYLRPGVEFGVRELKLQVAQALAELPPGASYKAIMEALDKACRLAAQAAYASVVKKVPVNKGPNGGTLRQSINVQQRARFVYSIGTNVHYAQWVEEGTKEHEIYPKAKRCLAFYWDRLPPRASKRRKR